MIPIPKYLREIADTVSGKDETLTVRIMCPCGCHKFLIRKNVPKKVKLSKNDAARIRETRTWEDDFTAELCRKYGYDYGIEYNSEDCESYHEITIFKKDDLLYKKKDAEPLEYLRIESGQIPLSYKEISSLLSHADYTIIFKAICANCNKEYLLFDNRIHGNDAADFKPEKLEEYAFKPKKIGDFDSSDEIVITIKNFWDFEDIAHNGNGGLTIDDYSEMFSDIKIKVKTQDGKIITIYSDDLG